MNEQTDTKNTDTATTKIANQSSKQTLDSAAVSNQPTQKLEATFLKGTAP